MGRWDRKYSDDQCDAIVEAIIDRNMSAAQACAAAERGELGLEPFTFAAGTARDYARKERDRRQGKALAKAERTQSPEQRVDALVNRHLRMLEHETTRIEKAQRKADKAGFDPSLLERQRKALSVARELRMLMRGMAKVTGGGSARREKQAAQTPPSEGDNASHVLSELSAELQAQRGNEQNGAQNGSVEGGHVPSRAAAAGSSEPLPA